MLNRLFSKKILDKGNALARHIYNVKQLCNWVDVETEIGNYSYELEKTTPLANQQMATQLFYDEHTSLTKALYQYINSMRSCMSNPKMDTLINEWLNYTIKGNTTKLFVVNFNYNVWDFITFFNQVNTDNLICGEPLHIHGKTSYTVEDSDRIVLGVDATNKRGESHNFIVKAFNDQTRTKEYFSNIHNASKYIIFGCSMGSTDTRYFKPIFEKSKGKDFEIYGYKKIGLADIKSNISKMCNFEDFISNNNVTFLDSSSLS